MLIAGSGASDGKRKNPAAEQRAGCGRRKKYRLEKPETRRSGRDRDPLMHRRQIACRRHCAPSPDECYLAADTCRRLFLVAAVTAPRRVTAQPVDNYGRRAPQRQRRGEYSPVKNAAPSGPEPYGRLPEHRRSPQSGLSSHLVARFTGVTTSEGPDNRRGNGVRLLGFRPSAREFRSSADGFSRVRPAGARGRTPEKAPKKPECIRQCRIASPATRESPH